MHGEFIYHIGGMMNRSTNAPFEEWKYDREHGNFSVTLSNTELNDFYIYPETFIVNGSDYADCNFTV